jgi:DnaJ-class molecular chaperone
MLQLTDFITPAFVISIPLVGMIEAAWQGWRATRVRICPQCRGMGNHSGRADDLHTACHDCQGTGWTNSRNLIAR